TAAGAVSNVTTVATATTLTNLPTIPANWLTAAGIAASALDGKGDWNTTTPPTAIAIADQVWDEATSGHVVAGSFGVAATDTLADTNELQVDWVDGGRLDNLLDGAASAGDPWTTALPGAYGAGTAGEILGDWKDAGRLDALLDAIPTTPMRGTDSAMLATETGSSFTAIPWAAAWDAEVQSEVNDALVALGLDHLVGVAVTGTDVVDNSIIAKLVSKEAVADWDDFDNTTDSLQAIKDLGDSAWITATGFSTIVATDIVSSGAITTSAGAVSNVTTVATTTTNSDMLTAAAILTTQMTEAYAADGVAPTLAQALFLIQQALTEVSISSTTETIKKIDGSTTAATLTLNDATSPTSKTRAT
ncbi:MAG: hypothetical protein OEM58_12930, partial [Nitrospirota bacterium]|nr:hypothetical protein [Nitrospirota bacterium]